MKVYKVTITSEIVVVAPSMDDAVDCVKSGFGIESFPTGESLSLEADLKITNASLVKSPPLTYLSKEEKSELKSKVGGFSKGGYVTIHDERRIFFIYNSGYGYDFIILENADIRSIKKRLSIHFCSAFEDSPKSEMSIGDCVAYIKAISAKS